MQLWIALKEWSSCFPAFSFLRQGPTLQPKLALNLGLSLPSAEITNVDLHTPASFMYVSISIWFTLARCLHSGNETWGMWGKSSTTGLHPQLPVLLLKQFLRVLFDPYLTVVTQSNFVSKQNKFSKQTCNLVLANGLIDYRCARSHPTNTETWRAL